MAAKAMTIFLLFFLLLDISAGILYDPLVPMQAELNATLGVGAFAELATLITSVYTQARKIPKLTGDVAPPIRTLLKESSITINFNPSDYEGDVAKKQVPLKVMNVFDRGGNPSSERLATEEELFGYKNPSPNHPYYGAINFWDCALGAVPHETYGLAAFHLIDAVKEYSTFLYSDSLVMLETQKAVSQSDATDYINSLSYFIKEENPPKKKKPDEPGSSPYKPTITYFLAYPGVEDEIADLKFATLYKATVSPDQQQKTKKSEPVSWYFEVQIHGNVELEGAATKLDHLSGDFQNLFGTNKGKVLIAMAKRVGKPLIWAYDCLKTSQFAGIADLTATEIWTKWATLDTPAKTLGAFERLNAGKGSLTD